MRKVSGTKGILLVYDFALFFALAPISPMFCPQTFALALALALALYFALVFQDKIEGKGKRWGKTLAKWRQGQTYLVLKCGQAGYLQI